MRMKNIVANVAVFAAMSLSVFAAGDWYTDFDKAVVAAKKEKKDIFMEFTGSDWCPPCMELAKSVLSKDEFLVGAKKDFVLLKLDFPRKTPLPEEEAKKNHALAARYAIKGYPTVLLVDETGLPYAAAGRESNPAAYLKMLKGLMSAKVEMKKAFGDARKLNGKKKARALEKVLTSSPGLEPSMAYEPILKEIIAADPSDEFGMASSILIQARMSEVTEKGQVAAAFKEYSAYVAKTGAKGEDKQKLMLANLDVLYRLKDWHGMRRMVDEIVKVEPESEVGKQVGAFKPKIDQMEKDHQ